MQLLANTRSCLETECEGEECVMGECKSVRGRAAGGSPPQDRLFTKDNSRSWRNESRETLEYSPVQVQPGGSAALTFV